MSGPRAWAVPVVPNRTAAMSTWVRAVPVESPSGLFHNLDRNAAARAAISSRWAIEIAYAETRRSAHLGSGHAGRTRPLNASRSVPQRGRELRDHRPTARRPALAGRAHQAAADDHAVGRARPRRAACSGSRCRSRPPPAPRVAARTRSTVARQMPAAARRARRSSRSPTPCRRSRARRRRSAAIRSGVRRRRHQRHQREARRRRRPRAARRPRRAAGRARSARRRRPPRPAARSARSAARAGRVRVDHQHDRHRSREPLAQPEHAVRASRPPRSAAVPAAWITGPSASGSENGTPSSTRSAPASA